MEYLLVWRLSETCNDFNDWENSFDKDLNTIHLFKVSPNREQSKHHRN